MSDTIRYIIEALRQKGVGPGVTRDAGHPVRRMSGSLVDSFGKVNRDVNYGRYKKMQSDIGDTPVSYDEWMK